MLYVVLAIVALAVGAFFYFRKHRNQLAALEQWAKETEAKIADHFHKHK